MRVSHTVMKYCQSISETRVKIKIGFWSICRWTSTIYYMFAINFFNVSTSESTGEKHHSLILPSIHYLTLHVRGDSLKCNPNSRPLSTPCYPVQPAIPALPHITHAPHYPSYPLPTTHNTKATKRISLLWSHAKFFFVNLFFNRSLESLKCSDRQ